MKLTAKQTNNLAQLAYNLIEAKTPPFGYGGTGVECPQPGPSGWDRMQERGMRDALDALGIDHAPLAVTQGFRRGVMTIGFPWPGRDVPVPDDGECVPSEAECRAVARLWERGAAEELSHRRGGRLAEAGLAEAYCLGIKLTLRSAGVAYALTAHERRLEIDRGGCDCHPEFMVLGEVSGPEWARANPA